MLAYASVRIEEPRVCAFGERSEKLLHGGVLIRRARELRVFPSVLLLYSRRRGRAILTTLLNPPPENSAATSGMEVVPPTAVTLCAPSSREASMTDIHKWMRNTVDPLWTARGESGYELSPVLAVIREARLRLGVGVPISNTGVPRTVDQRSAACA
jgi:hypothetical protein